MNLTMHRAVFAAFALLVGMAASAGAQESPQWTVGLRGGTWSVPNTLLDRYLDEHPSVDGESFGITFCPLGESGATGVFNVVYALDYGSLSGSGIWRADDDEPEDQRDGKASLDLLAVTINFMWDIMPEWRVHPYLGLGLGVAYADGRIPGEEGEEDETYKGPAPVLQLPVGLKAILAENFSLQLEARWFTAGVVLGGGAAMQW
ncbi:MAG: outer membrane beta-barrel protein [Verrucomicrobia bacterium]|nr:outer membrane beta-barrel protein [Verrucomicrobiota bacterium]MBU1910068.1 outer membrane beta-barrel protein [Verrucomicrobiota bacterium]